MLLASRASVRDARPDSPSNNPTCTGGEPPPPHPGASTASNLGQETIAPDEAALITRIADIITAMQQKEYPPGKRPMHREAHAKHHGVVCGRFTVEPGLAPQLAVAVFAEPRSFDAYVRFANGQGTPKHDAMPDGRGMAIKLLGVPGANLLDDPCDHGTQDFLFLAHPTFFVRTLADYVSLFEGLQHGKMMGHFFGWNPLHWRLRELGHALKHRVTQSNPLTAQYR